MINKDSGLNRVRQHLLSGKTITQNEALSLYGVGRLADVVLTLRKRNMLIETIMETHPTRYGTTGKHAKYVLSASQAQHA